MPARSRRCIAQRFAPFPPAHHCTGQTPAFPPMPRRCTSDVASLLATRAYERCLELGGGDRAVGLGCTAALRSVPMKRGDHRCFVAVRTAHGVYSLALTLAKACTPCTSLALAPHLPNVALAPQPCRPRRRLASTSLPPSAPPPLPCLSAPLVPFESPPMKWRLKSPGPRLQPLCPPPPPISLNDSPPSAAAPIGSPPCPFVHPLLPSQPSSPPSAGGPHPLARGRRRLPCRPRHPRPRLRTRAANAVWRRRVLAAGGG